MFYISHVPSLVIDSVSISYVLACLLLDTMGHGSGFADLRDAFLLCSYPFIWFPNLSNRIKCYLKASQDF